MLFSQSKEMTILYIILYNVGKLSCIQEYFDNIMIVTSKQVDDRLIYIFTEQLFGKKGIVRFGQCPIEKYL